MKTLLRYWLLRGFVFFAPVMTICGCASAPRLPVTVKVPVPVACEIEQVPASELPAATPDMNVFELARVAAARLKIQAAEILRLRAANASPCPAVQP